MTDVDEYRRKVSESRSLPEFIEAYEFKWENTIDASPYGIQVTTEKRMIGELRKLLGRINNHEGPTRVREEDTEVK